MDTRIENIIYLDAGTLYGTPPFVQDFNNNEIQSSNDDNTTDDGTSEQETDNDMPELE